MSKPRLAHVVLGGCEGCYVSLLDAGEGLLELLGKVDVVASPIVSQDELRECDVVIVEGAVTTEADEKKLLAARAAGKTLIALGSCAALGGIGGLRNLHSVNEVMAEAYGEERPAAGDGLPRLTGRVKALSDVVDVDISILGCAPETETILSALNAVVDGREWSMPRRNMCDECVREKRALLEPTAEFLTDAVYGLMELDEIDPTLCFLEQGVICMGPMTREGCGARCTAAGVPCRGCQGPSRPEFEQGAKMIDALAAVLPAGAIMFLDDLVGTGYRFSMPVSVFPQAYDHGGDEDA